MEHAGTGSALEAILIAGPTASGKSAMALALAEALGGVVINADSMQVYRDLAVLTARPTPEEEARAPHRLYGHVDGAVNYSVGRWLADVGPELAAAAAAGRTAIVIGGTGLYFKALLDGLSDIPPVPDDVREAVRAGAGGRPTPLLHADLAARDPETAKKLSPNDRQRLLRALEVLAATGRSLTAFHDRRSAPLLDAARCRCLFLAPEREALLARIDARFEAMLAAGALEEVRALAARRLSPDLPVMRAHGVPWLTKALAGEIEMAEAIARGKADTRHYAKRQLTWFRHQLPGFAWVAPAEARSVAFIRRAIAPIDSG